MSSKMYVSEEGAQYSEEELKTLPTEYPDDEPGKFYEVYEVFEAPNKFEGWQEHKKKYEEKIKELKEEYEEWLLKNPEENFEWVEGINWEDDADNNV